MTSFHVILFEADTYTIDCRDSHLSSYVTCNYYIIHRVSSFFPMVTDMINSVSDAENQCIFEG